MSGFFAWRFAHLFVGRYEKSGSGSDEDGGGELPTEVAVTIETWIETQREAFGVPGMAVGAIQGGKVVVNQGFGLRDVQGGNPVTPDTAFAIGSATKAFTAATVGALVDDGMLEWDRPVREYITNFQMYDHIATESLTPRDLLCHRSGLPRHDWIWQGGRQISRAEAVSLLRYLQPTGPFRTTFQYNNLMYMTAGHLCEVTTGERWEELVTRRIFERAAMTSSSFSQESGTSTEVSQPYGKRKGEVTQLPYAPEMDLMAPAGGIYSTLTDMMNWLQVSLNFGKLTDASVLSRETVRELFSPQMVIRSEPTFPGLSDIAYGLGWIIGNYRGRKLVHHGGNIDGFSSLVAMLPEDRIGVVVLSNRYSSLIPWAVSLQVFDELLGLETLPWGERFLERQEVAESGGMEAKARAHRVPDAMPSHPLEAYAGRFSHPAYGSFVVDAANDDLTAEFRTLRPTLRHRHYDTFSIELQGNENAQLYASFLTDPEGRIAAISIPFEPNVEPIVFKREPEMVTIETCERLTGTYEMGPIEFTIDFIAPDRLVARTPGGVSYRLVPYDGLTFGLEGLAGASASFELDEEGFVREIVVQPMGVFRPKLP